MAQPSSKNVLLIDGSVDFSGGVNSNAVTTIQSERNPNGLRRDQLGWMDNSTIRNGGITQRPGWNNQGQLPAGATGLYQGKFVYEPDSEDPYLIVAIGGHIWKMNVDDPASAVDLSLQFSAQGPAQSVIPDGQVCVVLRQDGVMAAGTQVFGPFSSVIGTFSTFFAPGQNNTVRVPTWTIYGGPLGVSITLGGIAWTIMSSEGWNAIPGTTLTMANDPNLPRFYFAQAEQFLVIQAGDLVTLPMIWNGSVLRRSLGLSGSGVNLGISTYGSLAAITLSTWTVPAQGGTITLPLMSNYTGVVGDQLTYLPYPYRVVNGLLTSFTNAGIGLQVQSIGANSITVMVTGFIPPYIARWVLYGSELFKLNFVVSPPSHGSASSVGTPEIPPATAMDYYMGRLWYAQGRRYCAGDIVGNQSSGSSSYSFRDSVLKVTENPLAVGGDGFTVPTNAGNIRAIKHSSNINVQLGEGQLFIFTRRSIYALTVPVTRTDWIGATNANQPLQTVVQVTNGSVNDRSVASQNGDLFFQSFEPSIRSLITAVRNFGQWGNVPISINETRILKFNDRSLMQFASGISFDNRLLQTALPYQSPVGAAFRALIPLNFDVVSTMETQKPPAWEGMYEGANLLELSMGDFGGRPRAFAMVWSDISNAMELWEITDSSRFDGDNRVMWYVEFPAYTWGDEFMLKKLVSAELWIDRIYGEVMFSMDYRPDSDSCWYKWHEWKLCTARNSCEDVHNPACLYPQTYGESFRQTVVLPNPPEACSQVSKRPTNIGFQFQPRLTIKGFCRIRGLLLKAERREQETYGSDMVC